MAIQAVGQSIWDEGEDKDILRQFLSTRTGERLVARLADEAPALLGAGDTNAILIRNGEARGFALAISKMLELAFPPAMDKAVSEPSSYPPLEDDSQWQDGNKITQTKETQ